MAVKDRVRLTVSLRTEDFEKLAEMAEKSGVQISRMAARFIEEGMAQQANGGVDDEASKAESELVAWVAARADRMSAEGWEPHVTLRIFQALEAEQLDLYRRAISRGDQARINRQLGSIVRQRLNAVTQMTNKAVKKASTKPGESGLIASYTLLYPGDGSSAVA